MTRDGMRLSCTLESGTGRTASPARSLLLESQPRGQGGVRRGRVGLGHPALQGTYSIIVSNIISSFLTPLALLGMKDAPCALTSVHV